MFGNTKVKIAVGLATGALTLGAAGAYAAANNTITVTNPTPITVTGGTTTNPLSLISVSGKTTTLTLPASFKNEGQCVSMFAKNKDLALAPTTTSTGPLKLAKNYHGKLVSSMTTWCKTQTAASTTTDSTGAQTAETPDATQSTAPSTDSSDATSATHGQSGQAHGKSQSHGHGHTGA